MTGPVSAGEEVPEEGASSRVERPGPTGPVRRATDRPASRYGGYSRPGQGTVRAVQAWATGPAPRDRTAGVPRPLTGAAGCADGYARRMAGGAPGGQNGADRGGRGTARRVQRLPPGRLVDESVVELTTEATIVRINRGLSGSGRARTPDRRARRRVGLTARAPRTPPDEPATRNARPVSALAEARRLVAVLGGEPTVASEPGTGSVFTVRLPPRPAEAGPAA